MGMNTGTNQHNIEKREKPLLCNNNRKEIEAFEPSLSNWNYYKQTNY